jgi:hypothetical protein
MHLECTRIAFRTILSLKETKINGSTIDHYRKHRSGGTSINTRSILTLLAFTKDIVSLAGVRLGDFFATKRSRRWKGISGRLILGPGCAVLPQLNDHKCSHAEVDFDFVAKARTGSAVLTTQLTDRHEWNKDGTNVEAISACFKVEDRFGKEGC